MIAQPTVGSYICRCECGATRKIIRSSFLRGNNKSCGCLRSELSKQGKLHRTHGKENTKIYGIYRTMLTRCYNKNSEKYSRYGGRGIRVSDEWQTFENFYRDMGDPPAGMSLDRIDNDGPYSKDNCRWATGKTQCNNTRRNIWITARGESKTISQWAEVAGVDCRLVHARLQRGWDPERAIFEPAREGNYHQKRVFEK